MVIIGMIMSRFLRRAIVGSIEVSRKTSERGYGLSSTGEDLLLSLDCKAGVVAVSTCFSTPERT